MSGKRREIEKSIKREVGEERKHMYIHISFLLTLQYLNRLKYSTCFIFMFKETQQNHSKDLGYLIKTSQLQENA